MSAEKAFMPAATERFDTIDILRGYSLLQSGHINCSWTGRLRLK
jgi:uncharacterized membrane protein YeiB